MSNDYLYCPVCGDKLESWSGFWPDEMLQVRRATIHCNECGFSGNLSVDAGDKSIPTIDLQSLRDNAE